MLEAFCPIIKSLRDTKVVATARQQEFQFSYCSEIVSLFICGLQPWDIAIFGVIMDFDADELLLGNDRQKEPPFSGVSMMRVSNMDVL
jgi:hypothetical protein